MPLFEAAMPSGGTIVPLTCRRLPAGLAAGLAAFCMTSPIPPEERYESRVETRGGVPTFVVSGRPHPGVCYSSYDCSPVNLARRAGVKADLHIYEGFSHGDYMVVMNAPESFEPFAELNRFVLEHLSSSLPSKSSLPSDSKEIKIPQSSIFYDFHRS
jgi:hypothetical protein